MPIHKTGVSQSTVHGPGIGVPIVNDFFFYFISFIIILIFIYKQKIKGLKHGGPYLIHSSLNGACYQKSWKTL